MVTYLVVITVLYISAFVNFGKLHKGFYWSMVFILAIISGIRYYVGTDFGVQINYYNWTLAGLTDGWLEPGFRWYIRTIDKLFGDFRMFIFVAAIFVIFCFGYGIYKNVSRKYQFFSLAIFVTSTIYFATMNLERQYIAISFLILSVESLKEKKYVRVVIFFLCAVSFHESAICFIAFYLLYMCLQKNSWREIIYKAFNAMLIIAVIAIFIDARKIISENGRFIIPAAYRGYLDSKFFLMKDWSSLLKMIVPLIIWFYLYYALDIRNSKDKRFDVYVPAYVLWLCVNVIFSGINVFIRIGMYFEYFILFLFPLIVERGVDRKSRMFIKVLFLGYFFALTSYSIFYGMGHGVMPYQTIFNNI